MRIKNKFFGRFKSALFTAVLISCLSLSPIRIAYAEEPAEQKPYKATTVDECIREEACVWYAFDLLVTQDYQNLGTGTVVSADDNVKIRKETHEKWKLIKWLRSPVVAIIGNQSRKEIGKIEKLSKKIQPFFNYEIKIENKNYNIIIIISDDIKGEVLGKYISIFRIVFGPLLPNILKEITKDNLVCKVLPEKNVSYGVEYSIISVDSKYKDFFDKCLAVSFYGSLAYPYKILNFPDKDVVNLDFVQETLLRPEISELDLLLLKIIQNPKLIAGMTYEHVKEKFHEVYIESVAE